MNARQKVPRPNPNEAGQEEGIKDSELRAGDEGASLLTQSIVAEIRRGFQAIRQEVHERLSEITLDQSLRTDHGLVARRGAAGTDDGRIEVEGRGGLRRDCNGQGTPAQRAADANSGPDGTKEDGRTPPCAP